MAIQAERRANCPTPYGPRDADLEAEHAQKISLIREQLSANRHDSGGTSEAPPATMDTTRGGYMRAAGNIFSRMFRRNLPERITNTYMKPTIGRIVLYVLSAADAVAINDARLQKFAHEAPDSGSAPTAGFTRQGNAVIEGDIFPADVVRVFDNSGELEDPPINLQVKLNGNDSYWATSRHNSDEKTPGTWHWMEYQKQQAAKDVALAGEQVGSVGVPLTPGAAAFEESIDAAPPEEKPADYDAGSSPPPESPAGQEQPAEKTDTEA
jgi:hypothetical protein